MRAVFCRAASATKSRKKSSPATVGSPPWNITWSAPEGPAAASAWASIRWAVSPVMMPMLAWVRWGASSS